MLPTPVSTLWTMGLRLLFCLILPIALTNSLNDWRLTSGNLLHL